MKPTQNDRILAWLKRTGRTSQLDWIGVTVDGGPQILRVPSRVDELRKHGHDIKTTRPRKGGVAVYVLARGLEVSTVETSEPVGFEAAPPLVLVDEQSPAPTSAIFDWDEP